MRRLSWHRIRQTDAGAAHPVLVQRLLRLGLARPETSADVLTVVAGRVLADLGLGNAPVASFAHATPEQVVAAALED